MEHPIFGETVVQAFFVQKYGIRIMIGRKNPVGQILVWQIVLRVYKGRIFQIRKDGVKLKSLESGTLQHGAEFRLAVATPLKSIFLFGALDSVKIPLRIRIPVSAEISEAEAVVHPQKERAVGLEQGL